MPLWVNSNTETEPEVQTPNPTHYRGREDQHRTRPRFYWWPTNPRSQVTFVALMVLCWFIEKQPIIERFRESFFAHMNIFNRAIFQTTSISKYLGKCQFLKKNNNRIKTCDTEKARLVTVNDSDKGFASHYRVEHNSRFWTSYHQSP